ncbi:P-loop NTPase fold protein, partial [Vibrio parahaemolyticus]
MSIKDKCDLIKANIKNKDLPRMVTIDGSWGCGKTTFVKKHLMTHMEEMNPVYLSLTGVTDIAVFKDRL